MILGTLQLLKETPDPSEIEIRDMLSGILDRETAYVKPVAYGKAWESNHRGEAKKLFATGRACVKH